VSEQQLENDAEIAELSDNSEEQDNGLGTAGIIYIIENEAFESPVVKIGRATNLSQRINTLNTGVPLPFTCYKASRVADMVAVERLLHQTFAPAKNHWTGEFFEVEAWRVAQVLQLCEIDDVTHLAPKPTPEDEKLIGEKVQARDRKQTATFESLGLSVESELTFSEQPEIKCYVADTSTSVHYQGEVHALSTLTTKLKNSPRPVQGIRYWMFEDETLLKRRDRLQLEANSATQ